MNNLKKLEFKKPEVKLDMPVQNNSPDDEISKMLIDSPADQLNEKR